MASIPIGALGLVTALVVFGQYSPALKPSEVSIGLERTPCFGMCRTYKLTVGGDGSVRYEGLADVATVGVRQDTISIESVVRLLNEFLRVRFMDALDRYADRESVRLNNGEFVIFRGTTTDLPSQILTLRLGAKSKKVVLYDNFPAELGALPNLVDEVTNSKRWTQQSPAGSTDTAARDAQAIALAKRTIVREIESALSAVSFEEWLRTTTGRPASSWGVNDCGEQTGNPDLDRGRDFPMCVESITPLTGDRTLIISLAVGTFKKGVGPGTPGLWSAFLIAADKKQREIKKLADVPAAIRF
jgi:hypothetical protein